MCIWAARQLFPIYPPYPFLIHLPNLSPSTPRSLWAPHPMLCASSLPLVPSFLLKHLHLKASWRWEVCLPTHPGKPKCLNCFFDFQKKVYVLWNGEWLHLVLVGLLFWDILLKTTGEDNALHAHSCSCYRNCNKLPRVQAPPLFSWLMFSKVWGIHLSLAAIPSIQRWKVGIVEDCRWDKA